MNEAQQAAYNLLARRTISVFKRSHVIQQANGYRLCLDMNFEAATDEDLLSGIWERCMSLGPDGVPTPAPPEQWERFVAIDQTKRRHLYLDHTACGRPRTVAVIIRIEE